MENDLCKSVKEMLSEYQKRNENETKKRNELEEKIRNIERRNKQLESEIEHIEMQIVKKSEQQNKKHNERLKLAKKIIEMEERNEELENKIGILENGIITNETALKEASQPSSEALYREIMKGFGIDFINRDNKKIARIINKEKNNVYEVEITEQNKEEECDKLWKCTL